MSGLKTYQFKIELNTIYNIINFDDDFEYINSRIFFDAGTVDVYISEEIPSNKSEMFLQHENIAGIKSFQTVPNYIYIEQNTGVTDNIILTGVKPTEI